ncbi:MAG: vgr related protein [Sandarakinorhabdus sp.]|nr:vgr related protein [Sandarakinorhabdus sp.]
MTGRPLTLAERDLAQSVFHDAIDLDAVRINNRKYWPLQPRNVTMAPDGAIWFHPKGGLYCDCFGDASVSAQALLVHELVHVWQRQKGIFLPLARHPFCRYDYSLKPGWPLHRYGIEQQAEIVKHAWLLRKGYIVPGAPALSQYETMLPF